MATPTVKAEITVQAGLTVRPGDVLIVGVADMVTAELADRYKRRVMEMLPGLADVLVLSNVSHLAAYRPGED